MRVVAYIISPLHVLTALAAIRSRHGAGGARVTLVVHWPGASPEQSEELLRTAREITADLPDVDRCIGVTQADLDPLHGRTDVADAARALRRLVGQDVEEIYYAHDVIGMLYAMLAHAFPDAERICIGDGMGIVYERSHHLSYLGIAPPPDPEPIAVSRLRRLADRLARSVGRGAKRARPEPLLPFGTGTPRPDRALLVLPVDQSGGFLDGLPWSVVPAPVIREVVDEIGRRCAPFASHVDALLAQGEGRRKYLLMTENNAEGAFMSFERDIDMYCAIVARHCPPGSTIYLKSHPGETLPRNEAIGVRLAGDYSVVPLDARFKRYPIEIAGRLVRECVPICMSYPRMSLKFLFGVDVIQPADDAFIEEWYPERYWNSYKNSLSLYEKPLSRLGTWDGRALLWSGGEEPDSLRVRCDDAASEKSAVRLGEAS